MNLHGSELTGCTQIPKTSKGPTALSASTFVRDFMPASPSHSTGKLLSGVTAISEILAQRKSNSGSSLSESGPVTSGTEDQYLVKRAAAVTSLRRDNCGLSIAAILGVGRGRSGSIGGTCGAFKARGTDGRIYFVKTLNNYHSPRTLVAEQIVARAGLLIGAPVCEVNLIRIPNELIGEPFAPYRLPPRLLEAGIAHASRAINPALETRHLLHRQDDDNEKRHAGIYALFDWCWGSDNQWLYATSNLNSFYSHDHGWFFPPGGPPFWTIETLVANVHLPNQLGEPTGGLRKADLLHFANVLESVQEQSIVNLVAEIPRSWEATDQELAHIADFLIKRAPMVSGRLRSLAQEAI